MPQAYLPKTAQSDVKSREWAQRHCRPAWTPTTVLLPYVRKVAKECAGEMLSRSDWAAVNIPRLAGLPSAVVDFC